MKRTNVRKLPFLWVDFLGFGEILVKEPETFHKMPEILLKMVLPNEILGRTDIFQYVLLSDTLVLCPGDDRPKDDNLIIQFMDIVRIASVLFGKSIRNKMPIRGTLAFGEIVFRTEVGQSMVIGAAVMDAYKLEKIQDWIGITLSPESLRLLRIEEPELNIEKTCAGKLVRYDSIPLSIENKPRMQGYVVQPAGKLEKLKERLEEKMLESPLDSQQKFEHTLRFVKHLQELSPGS